MLEGLSIYTVPCEGKEQKSCGVSCFTVLLGVETQTTYRCVVFCISCRVYLNKVFGSNFIIILLQLEIH